MAQTSALFSVAKQALAFAFLASDFKKSFGTLRFWTSYRPPLALLAVAIFTEFICVVLDLFFLMCSHIPVPPGRGRSHETHANGEGCGA